MPHAPIPAQHASRLRSVIGRSHVPPVNRRTSVKWCAIPDIPVCRAAAHTASPRAIFGSRAHSLIRKLASRRGRGRDCDFLRLLHGRGRRETAYAPREDECSR